MLIEIDYHSGVPIYRQLIVQIRQQIMTDGLKEGEQLETCLLYTSPSPRDGLLSRMPSSA